MSKAKQQEAREFLARRQQAYQQVLVEDSVHVKEMMEDLGRFCRANASTGHENPYVSARLDGRREVYLRIMDHLKLNADDLWVKYSGLPVSPLPNDGEDE